MFSKSSAMLWKNVNIDVLINSGQFFTRDLYKYNSIFNHTTFIYDLTKIYFASIALTRTCKHRTVIRTSAPKAINLDLKRFANLQNKLKHTK